MSKLTCLFTILFLMVPGYAFAEQIRVPSNTAIKYELPSGRWEVSVDTPDLAIEAMVVDMEHAEEEKKGQKVDREELRKKAEKFLKVNSLYIFNRATEAYLMISYSALKPGDAPLSKEAIQRSVEWTIEALNDHADVDNLDQYETTVEEIQVPGLEYAQMISSNNPLFGDPHYFIGIIGYKYPYWAFMFYNDKAVDPSDLSEMKKIIRSIELTSP